MTEKRARELAELTPPPSLYRLVLFLDDLSLRVGFETSFGALDSEEQGAGGLRPTSASRHQSLVSELLSRRQIEPTEILAFSLWLRKWNERREQTETIQLEDFEKPAFGWKEDQPQWHSPDRPLFRPRLAGQTGEEIAEFEDVAGVPNRYVAQAAGMAALPQMGRIGEAQAQSFAALVPANRATRTSDILDRAWEASRDPQSPSRPVLGERTSTSMGAETPASSRASAATRREGEMPLASVPPKSEPSKSEPPKSESSKGVQKLPEPAPSVASGQAPPASRTSVAPSEPLASREEPTRRSRAKAARGAEVEPVPAESTPATGRRQFDLSKPAKSSTASEFKGTEYLEAKVTAPGVIEPTAARLSNPNMLNVFNRVAWSVNAVGGGALASYGVGVHDAMGLSRPLMPTLPAPTASVTPVGAPLSSPWTSPNLPLPSSSRPELPIGSGTNEYGYSDAAPMPGVRRSRQRATATIEILDEETQPARQKETARAKRQGPQPQAARVLSEADEWGAKLPAPAPQGPLAAATAAMAMSAATAAGANTLSTIRPLTPQITTPISSPLEALRLPAPALADQFAPTRGAAGAPLTMPIAGAPSAQVPSATMDEGSVVGETGPVEVLPPNRQGLRPRPPASSSMLRPVGWDAAGASPYMPSQMGEMGQALAPQGGAASLPWLLARDLPLARWAGMGGPLAAALATAILGGNASAASLTPGAASLSSFAGTQQGGRSAQITARPPMSLTAFPSRQSGQPLTEENEPGAPWEAGVAFAGPVPGPVVIQGQNPRGVQAKAGVAEAEKKSPGQARMAGSRSALDDPRWGQMTFVAPALRVASPEAEAGGANLAFNWSSLGASASTLDENGVAQLKSVLPVGAQAIYPALTPGSSPNAMTVALAPTMVARLLENYGGSTEAPQQRLALAQQLSDRGRISVASPSSAPVKAEMVPAAQRPMMQAAGVLAGAPSAKSAGALQEAGEGQATRGGAFDFLGLPVRLAPSLGGRSELSDEVAVRRAADATATPGAVRPQLFGSLRNRLFPAMGSTEVEPDRRAWEKAAPDFGLASASPQAILAPDNRVKTPAPSEPQAAPTTAPQSETSSFGGFSPLSVGRPFTPPLGLATPSLAASTSTPGMGALSSMIPTFPASVPTASGVGAGLGLGMGSFSVPGIGAPSLSGASLLSGGPLISGAPTAFTSPSIPSSGGAVSAPSFALPTSLGGAMQNAPSFSEMGGSFGAPVGGSEPIYSPPTLGRPQPSRKSLGQILPTPDLSEWANGGVESPGFFAGGSSGATPSSGGTSSSAGGNVPSLASTTMAARPAPFAPQRPANDSLPQSESSSFDATAPTVSSPTMGNLALPSLLPSARVMSSSPSSQSTMTTMPSSPFSRAPMRVFPASPSAPASVSIQRSVGGESSPASSPTAAGGKKQAPQSKSEQTEIDEGFVTEVWMKLKQKLDFERQRMGY